MALHVRLDLLLQEPPQIGRGVLAPVGRRQLRLSYGFEDVDRILRALELMRGAAEFARSREAAGVAS